KVLRMKTLELENKLESKNKNKTNNSRWNFTEFKHHADGEKINLLEEAPEAIKDFIDPENENVIIIRNQTVAYASISKELEDQGVIFTDIFTALRDHEELVKEYYMTDVVTKDEHKLTALHAAIMNGGIFVYVPKNVKIEAPIQTLFWQEDNEDALFNHVIVVADEGSSVTYVANYFSQNETEKSVSNIVAEVYAHDNAYVSFGG